MASLDMSLDDMIKSRRITEKGNGRGKAARGRGGSGRLFRGGKTNGAPRRGPPGVNSIRPTPNVIAKSFRRTKNFHWKQDLFEDSLRAVGLNGAADNSTRLYISNLDAGVTNEDIKELFAELGALKRYAVHYNSTGRSSGTAEVVYVRRSDAFQAVKRYNNVQLDGKPMKIEIVGTNSEIPVSARINVFGRGGAFGKRTVVMGGQRGRGRGSAVVNRGFSGSIRGGFKNTRGRGGGGRGGRGRGRGGKKVTAKSADELDKELESYHAESMQI